MKYKGIPDLKQLEAWNERRVPFEYNDFMWPHILDKEEEIQTRIKEYLKLSRDRREDTVHGPFLDIAIHSSDAKIRAVSDYRIRQVCDIAVQLQVKAIVLHTNFIPNFYDEQYRQNWIDRNEEYLKTLLSDYPGFYVYMENMFDEEPKLLVSLAERMKGERFGICLDIAHANLSKTSIREWHETCAPYIMQYHINDNDGMVDGHLPVGEGTIVWEKILPMLKKEIPLVVEVDSLEKYQKSICHHAFCDSDT